MKNNMTTAFKNNGLLQETNNKKAARKKGGGKCSFCAVAPAAVVVDLQMGRKRKVETLLCWEHYYTSRAVRLKDVKHLAETNEIIKEELKEAGVQDIFAEAYLELQQELATESAMAFKKQKSDPLSILNNFRSKPKKKKPPAPKKQEGIDASGGFLRSVPIPERFRRTQEAMSRTEQDEIKAASAASSSRIPNLDGNPYKKRKASRQSIWKLAAKPPEKEIEKKGEKQSATREIFSLGYECSCGATDVHSFGNITSRNNDVAKAETWGFKDRADEVVVRCRCNVCGKTWNDES